MTISTLELQKALVKAGLNPGPVDGVPGRMTTDAVKAFQKLKKLVVDGVVGEKTLFALKPFLAPSLRAAEFKSAMVPWVERILSFLGTTEVRGAGSNAKIRGMWLRAGGWISNFFETKGGDDIPWCGLLINDAISTTLPNEPLPKNPLSALAWQTFGVSISLEAPRFGAIGIKKRKGGGHVFIIVGANATHYFALGGNQSNSVNVTRILKSEVVSIRWPSGVEIPPYVPLVPWTGSVAAAGSEA